MLALISWGIAAVIFLLIGLTTIIEDTEDVRWLAVGFFFLALGLIFYTLSGPYERWRGRVP